MAAWSFTTEINGGTFTDGYDAEDRFRRFIQSSQSNDIYLARSDIGNISDVEINSVSHLRSYSNAHELTTVDGTPQTFDDDGNLTLSHHGITVAWDDANRLTQTVVPATATAGIEGTNDYGYNADGKRVWKKITRSGAVAEHTVYIYAGPNCIAEYNSGELAASPVQEYVYAGSIDSLVLLSRNSDADRYVATRNQQWSITALADLSNGTVQERYTYGPFGKRTILAPDGSTLRTASSYNMPYGYTSRRHDADSGLMYFRARYYDPSTGEFTSPDPLEYVDGMSMFRGYMGQNGIDPLGGACRPPTNVGANYVAGRGNFVAGLPRTGYAYDPNLYGIPDDRTSRGDYIIAPIWMDAEWTANPRAFRDGEECCCCDEIGFVQIYKQVIRRRRMVDERYPHWRIDADFEIGGDLYYPYGSSIGTINEKPPTASGVCEGPPKTIGVSDRPQQTRYTESLFGINHYLLSWQRKAEVCVFCVRGKEGPVEFTNGFGERLPGHDLADALSGGTAIAVYGCFSWTFSVRRENGNYITDWTYPEVNPPHLNWWADAFTIRGMGGGP